MKFHSIIVLSTGWCPSFKLVYKPRLTIGAETVLKSYTHMNPYRMGPPSYKLVYKHH